MGKKDFLPDLVKQFKYYSWGMFKGEKHPFLVTEERKFNPLQKLTYVLAMYVAVPLLITMGFFLTIFMVIHIYTCTLGAKPSSLFWGMITGYHRSEDH